MSPLSLGFVCLAAVLVAEPDLPELKVSSTEDFTVDGTGKAAAWEKAPWVPLHSRPGGELSYPTQFKLLYSQTGLYVLLDGDDARLSARLQEDFADLWKEDVFEFFIWPDERFPVYFEYEISPLGHELPILIPNLEGKFMGWRPWHYEGPRRIQKGVAVRGGPAESDADISGWRAEIFMPYELLRPLTNVPPQSGTRWRANFYRMDYDHGQTTGWDWARVGPSFHEYRKFGRLIFE